MFCIFIFDKSKEVIFVTLDMLENEGYDYEMNFDYSKRHLVYVA